MMGYAIYGRDSDEDVPPYMICETYCSREGAESVAEDLKQAGYQDVEVRELGDGGI